MPTRSPEIITRASEVDEDLVPEPWDLRDSKGDRSLVAERERYRLQGVTDGQGAGIVPAYNLNVADTGSIPSKTKGGWTRGSAGRVLGPDGKYVSKGSDVPRKSFDGEEPGLLVEAAGRTNEITYSSDFIGADWLVNGPTFTPKSSILKSETAQELSISGESDNISNNRIGTFSNSLETYSIIIEYIGGQAAVSRISMFSDVNGRVAYGNYFWDTNSTTTNLGSSTDARVLKNNGPNGGKVVQFTLRYDPSTDSEGSNGRQILLFPDRSGNNENMIFHHAQIEEAPNASSPIVTQGSSVTRSGDDYAIFEGGQPSWWNPNEGSFFFEYQDKRFNKTKSTLLDDGTNSQIVNIDDGSIITKDGSNTLFAPKRVNSFTTQKIAVSFDGSSKAISVDGSSNSGYHSGSYLSATTLRIDIFNNLIGSFRKIVYYPRALPESTLNRITAQ